MVMSRDGQTGIGNLEVNDKEFERTSSFKYLGSLLTEQNDNLAEIKERINTGNRCYFSILHMLKSRALSRK